MNKIPLELTRAEIVELIYRLSLPASETATKAETDRAERLRAKLEQLRDARRPPAVHDTDTEAAAKTFFSQNPEHFDVVEFPNGQTESEFEHYIRIAAAFADLRTRELRQRLEIAASLMEKCPGCDGHGTQLGFDGYGASRYTCSRCGGDGMTDKAREYRQRFPVEGK